MSKKNEKLEDMPHFERFKRKKPPRTKNAEKRDHRFKKTRN